MIQFPTCCQRSRQTLKQKQRPVLALLILACLAGCSSQTGQEKGGTEDSVKPLADAGSQAGEEPVVTPAEKYTDDIVIEIDSVQFRLNDDERQLCIRYCICNNGKTFVDIPRVIFEYSDLLIRDSAGDLPGRCVRGTPVCEWNPAPVVRIAAGAVGYVDYAIPLLSDRNEIRFYDSDVDYALQFDADYRIETRHYCQPHDDFTPEGETVADVARRRGWQVPNFWVESEAFAFRTPTQPDETRPPAGNRDSPASTDALQQTRSRAG